MERGKSESKQRFGERNRGRRNLSFFLAPIGINRIGNAGIRCVYRQNFGSVHEHIRARLGKVARQDTSGKTGANIC